MDATDYVVPDEIAKRITAHRQAIQDSINALSDAERRVFEMTDRVASLIENKWGLHGELALLHLEWAKEKVLMLGITDILTAALLGSFLYMAFRLRTRYTGNAHLCFMAAIPILAVAALRFLITGILTLTDIDFYAANFVLKQ